MSAVDEQLVPDTDELHRLRDEVRELRESVYRLRAHCEFRVKELQDELDDEKTARQRLVSDVERLKKIVNMKLRPF